jgi:hypothetical protein
MHASSFPLKWLSMAKGKTKKSRTARSRKKKVARKRLLPGRAQGHTRTRKAAATTASVGGARKKKRRVSRSTRLPAIVGIPPGLALFINKSSELGTKVRLLSKDVTLTVAPRTISGEPIQEQRGRLHARNIDDFRPRPDAVGASIERLNQLGFKILRQGRFGITVSAPAKLISDTLKVSLLIQARPHRSSVRATQNFAASYFPPVQTISTSHPATR